MRNEFKTSLVSVLLLLSAATVLLGQQSPSATKPKVLLTLTTEPNASVWIDEIRRGNTDESGKLEITTLKPGRHRVRVRAMGFREVTVPLVSGRRQLAVKLVRTTDRGELLFQQAESAREKARDDEARKQAIELYQDALKVKPTLASAHVALARLYLELNDYNQALTHITAARRLRPIYPEASAVEGRVLREAAFEDQAIQSFQRAIREAKGFQPEAHVGLARALEDKGDTAQAIREYRIALDQLSDSELVIYQLLGAAYERTQNYKEAVTAYEKYLALAPNGSLAPAIRSIIDQLRRDAAGQEIIP